MEQLLKEVKDVETLAERLAKAHSVQRLSAGEHDEAWVLAHSFSDIEESFRRIFEEHIPSLLNESVQESRVNDHLLDIGEEFRHILYHIEVTRFYEYLKGSNKA